MGNNSSFDESIKDLKKTNWISYLMFLCIGLIIGAIFSSLMIYFANEISDGSKQGDELKMLLSSTVAKELRIDKNDLSMDVLFKGSTEPLYSEDLILASGMYKKGTPLVLADKEQFNGRFIVIFEKKKKDFLNYLFSTSAEYTIKYFAICEDDNFDNKTFYNVGFDLMDVDKNGKEELIMGFRTHFADRISESTIILTRKAESWNIIMPNLDIALDEIKLKDDEVIALLIDTFDLVEDGNQRTIYSFSYGGYLLWGDNPIDNKRKLCAKIALLKEDEYLLQKHEYAYFMFSYAENGLIPDKLWNRGEPLISKEIINEDELFAMELWGSKINNTIFYTLEDML